MVLKGQSSKVYGIEEERGGTRKAFTYFFEIIKEIACKNALMFKKMQNAYATSIQFPSTKPFCTAPFCSPLSIKNQACSALGTGTKDTEAVVSAASGVLCLNHVLNFLCIHLQQHHLSSCPMSRTSCGTFSRSSTLQRLLRSSTTCLCGLYHLEGWLVCDVGRRVSKLARVRIAVQDNSF